MAVREGYLVLEGGQVFRGTRFGEEEREVPGELVFTTAMTGYLETLTDPSYTGQMVVQTFPLIGNYGVIPGDFESGGVYMSGYIVQEMCSGPSNFRSEGRLDTWLKSRGVPAFCLPETRQLTRLLRQKGVTAGMLCHSPTLTEAQWQALVTYKVRGAVAAAGRKTPAVFPAVGPLRKRVALWDFGAKGSIARQLCLRGAEVHALPAVATAEEILALRPDGVLLSNGPGDPRENTGIIGELQKLMGSGLPLFGICLGHQLMALAAGAASRKMKFGHRGANQPVVHTGTGRCFITSQNHGYCVEDGSLPPGVEMLYQNANDGSCEGLRYCAFPGFSVQFHPEANAGPQDTGFLFDEFMQLVEEVGAHA